MILLLAPVLDLFVALQQKCLMIGRAFFSFLEASYYLCSATFFRFLEILVCLAATISYSKIRKNKGTGVITTPLVTQKVYGNL